MLFWTHSVTMVTSTFQETNHEESQKMTMLKMRSSVWISRARIWCNLKMCTNSVKFTSTEMRKCRLTKDNYLGESEIRTINPQILQQLDDKVACALWPLGKNTKGPYRRMISQYSLSVVSEVPNACFPGNRWLKVHEMGSSWWVHKGYLVLNRHLFRKK